MGSLLYLLAECRAFHLKFYKFIVNAMKNLKARVQKEESKSPNAGCYFNFYRAVKEQNFSPKQIRISFGKLVSKFEYDKADKKLLLQELNSVSNTLRTDKNRGKLAISAA